MRTTTARLVALGMVIAACSGGTADTSSTTTTAEPTTTTSTSTTTSTTTTTTLPPTTTTTEPPGELSPINGLRVEDTTLLDRRVLAVKIDNHPRANPQTGIDEADMIIEVRVEGITRFLSIWHQSDIDELGPMRSGRPTDGSLLAGLNEPTFAISGAQDWIRSLIVGKDVNLIGETGRPATFRSSARSAPHNLYVNTFELRNVADGRGYSDEPPSHHIWEFGPMSDYAEPVSAVTLEFGSSEVTWTWNSGNEIWERTAYGDEGTYYDENGDEQRVEIPVLVVLHAESYTSSPSSGVSGSSVPSSRVTGSGSAYVFAGGTYSEGTWDRPSESEWFTLTDANGEVLLVPPGKVWVSIVPANQSISVEPR